MNDRPCGRNRQNQKSSARAANPAGSPGATSQTTTYTEPTMHRWPHPVDGVEPVRQIGPLQPQEAVLHYIQCSLSYQNQLLSDIKTLLERLTVEEDQGDEKE